MSTALVALLAQDGIKLEGPGEEKLCRCFTPHHDDKHPSMSVNAAKGVYHCHGCGAKGNAYSYLHDIRGLPPADAMHILKSQFGWDETRTQTARSMRDGQVATEAEQRPLEPARWCAEIYPVVSGHPLEAQHRFCKADGTLAWITARYGRNREGKPGPKGLPFVPAASKGGGFWNKSPVGSNRLAIPAADRPFADDEPCPVYGLPRLLRSPPKSQVWIVEGEKCADAVNACKGPPAISVRHGWTKVNPENPFPLLDLEPLRGRTVVVFADPDQVGRELANCTARHLHDHLDCTVKLMRPPIAGAHDQKIDVGDIAQQGGLPGIGGWAKTYGVKPYVPNEGKKDPVQAPVLAPLADTEHFKVLGLAADGHLVVRRKRTQEILLLRRAGMMMEGNLLQLAPLMWWQGQCGKSAFNSTMRSSFADALIRAGEELGFIDIAIDSAGRGAHERDGTVRFNLGDRLLEPDGTERLLTREKHLDDSDFLYKPGPTITLTDDDKAAEYARELFLATAGYRFQTPDAHRSVMGWVVTSIIGGALRFRPHLWILAPSGTGKTFLLSEILGRIFGPLALHISGGTEASLAGMTTSDSLPATMDEFEASKDREQKAKWDRMLELMRMATSGIGARTRASAHAGVQTTRPRFSAFVASINRPELDEADDNRFVTVRLSPVPVPDFEAVRKRIRLATDPAKMQAVRTRIIRHAQIIRDRAIEIEEAMIDSDQHMKTRHAQIMSSLTAGVWFLTGDEAVIRRDRVVKEDEFGPLFAMMGSLIPRPGLDDLTVTECLNRAYYPRNFFQDPDPNDKGSPDHSSAPAYKALCHRYGFRLLGDHELWVAPQLPLFRELMRRSKFPNLDWTTYLRTLPETHSPRSSSGRLAYARFGGVKSRVVVLGRTVLEITGFGPYPT